MRALVTGGTGPDQLPSDGAGPVRRKRFWARIVGSDRSAEELCRRFCDNFGELAPADTGVEPGAPVSEGATLTLRLPVRGTFQVRCEEVTPRRVTFAPADGHPLAGLVRFFFDPQRSGMLFETEVVASAATYGDLVALGRADQVQASAWAQVVERVVTLSGGTAPEGIHDSEEELEEEEVHELEEEMGTLFRRRQRRAAGTG